MGSTSPTDAELNTRIHQQEVVAELGQQAVETDDLDQLMHDASVAVAETLDNEYCKVLELLPSGDEVFLRQGVGWQEGYVGNATVPTDRDSQAGYTLLSEEPVIVDDLCTEERFSGPELLTNHDVVSGISVIIGSIEEPWGVLGTHTTEQREFTEHDANFVQSVANILASTIENERAQSELEEIYGRISDAFFALDEEWRFTHLNEQAHELINPEGQTLVGKHVWDEFAEAIDRKFKPKYEQAMYEQETVSFEEYYPEPLDIWAEVRAYPSETGLSVYFRDITERKEREQRLKQFKTVAETVSDVVLTIDDDSNIQYVNPASKDVFGYDADELIGESLTTLMPERFSAPHFEGIQSYLTTGERQLDWEYMELPGRHADGHEIPLGISFSEYTASGQHFFTGVIRDITERKERERDLREAKAQLEAATEAGAVGTWEWHVPEDQIVAGPTFAKTFGIDPAAAREGVSLEQFVSAIHADDRERVEQNIDAALDSCGEYEAEYRVKGPDDELRWVFARGHVECDEDGTPVRFPGALTDITERKQAEQELKRNKDQLQSLFELLPVGVVVADTDGRFVNANDTAKEIWGGDVFDANSIEEYAKYPAVWADSGEPVDPEEYTMSRALEGEEVTEPDVFEIEAADGERRIVRAEGMPVRDDRGEVVRGVITLTDITEHREYERKLEEFVEKLEESNERLEQFAYAASHDLQEPLRMVSSYLQLIEQRYADELDADGREFIDFAVDGADRMRDMIEGLLKYSRVDTQGDSFEPVELDDVLADARSDLQVMIEESDAKITAEPLPRIEGDGGQLRQVFQNLLDNAIEYSGDEPPQVDISAERNADEWLISVRDEGIGIDPDDADRIFDVFQSLHTPDDHAGTGIGLALVERIVERHGGDIWVESDPGDGATFSFTLPAAGDRRD